MHHNDGVAWCVSRLITESLSQLLSLFARAHCSICGRFIGCRKWINTPRCGGHISILPLFPLPLAKFLYQTRFGRGRLGRGRVKYRLPVPVHSPVWLQVAPVPVLAYFCTEDPVAAPWVAQRCAFAASRFPSHFVKTKHRPIKVRNHVFQRKYRYMSNYFDSPAASAKKDDYFKI